MMMNSYLESQKEILESKGFVLIPGRKYYNLLLHFGASIEDLEKLESGFIHERLARDREAVMSFRQIAFHRLLLDKEDVSFGYPCCSYPSLCSSSVHSDSSTISSNGTDSAKAEDEEYIIDRQEQVPTKISCAHREAVSQIGKEEICDDSRASISFKRSGNREYSLPPVEYIESTVPEAMA